MAINGNANGHNGNGKLPQMALRMAIMAIIMAISGNHKGIIMATKWQCSWPYMAMTNGHKWH